MANLLKWFWWRFNGYGYFWGMMTGIASALFVPMLMEHFIGHSINALYTFPVIFVVSVIGCIIGTLLTQPETEATLKSFYKTVNPWGFWGPVRQQVTAEDPAFKPNSNFGRDCINVLVGMVWQLCLVALPIFIVLRSWRWASGILVLLVCTSIFIKFNWYDKLEKAELAPGAASPQPAVLH
jgi:hypothetical protein